MRTISFRDIYSVRVVNENNGQFSLLFDNSVRHRNGEREQRVLSLHFDSFWWVGHIVRELWKVVKHRRSFLARELDDAENAMKGE